MSIAALFERLTDFAPHAARSDEAEGAHVAPPTYPQAVPDPDIPAMIAAAVAQAETDLAGRLQEEFNATLEAERRQHADELEALGTRLGAETGAAIVAGFGSAETRLVQLTTDAAARVIAGLVSDDIRDRSVAALAAAIASTLVDREAVRIKVSGPQLMFEALAKALGERADSLDYTETTSFDLSVAIDDNLFETRLGEWSAALSETLP
ncbi:hypothetical protein [Aminobacter sp. HY435]|uniref:hypothetical protein n=1 Tax=Aminobacter sp. HY435 TaxID=2970917 RepID=UPI0022B94162|nr:hypothetical protein [Aminobacter sp. HY435]